MSDIVERLREEPHRVSPGLVLEAAAEIERLRAALRAVVNDGSAPTWVIEKAKEALEK